MSWRNFFTIIVVNFIVFSQCAAAASNTVTRIGAGVGGFFGSYLVHETGHAVVTLLVGGDIESFTPYPHRTQGQIIPMGIEVRGQYKWQQFLMSLSGSGSSMAMAFFGAPLLKDIQDPHLRSFANVMAFTGALDWPVYSIWDGTTSFKGDWVWASKVTGLPRWVWVVPAVISSYFTLRRVIHYSQLKSGDKDDGVKYFTATFAKVSF